MTKTTSRACRPPARPLGIDYDTQVLVRSNVPEDDTCADTIQELTEAGARSSFPPPPAMRDGADRSRRQPPGPSRLPGGGAPRKPGRPGQHPHPLRPGLPGLVPGRHRRRTENRDQPVGLCGRLPLRPGDLRLHRLLPGGQKRQRPGHHGGPLHQRLVRCRAGDPAGPGAHRPGRRRAVLQHQHRRHRRGRPSQRVFVVAATRTSPRWPQTPP